MKRVVALLITLTLFITDAYSAATATTSFGDRSDVQAFINMMVKKYKFNHDELTILFNKVKIRPQVIRSIKKPLEKNPWHMYQMLFVNEWRIQHGVQFWNKYASVLKRAEKKYGVPASIIVATIGVETKYGQRTGDYRVMDSLSSIGFSDSPRAGYFRNELKDLLLLARDQKTNPLTIMGSYAGAIGQPQFMPSSYRHYAVNFSGTGKTDLMHNEVDVIGSIANYYSKHGWKMNQPVAISTITLGKRHNILINKLKRNDTVSIHELESYGIIPKSKTLDTAIKVKLIELQSNYSKEYWIGYNNFDVIKRYNPSDLYAMAVFQLSTYITTLRERLNHGQFD